jgi:hypothetical protein
MGPAIFLDALPLFFVMWTHHKNFREEFTTNRESSRLLEETPASPKSESVALSDSYISSLGDSDED